MINQTQLLMQADLGSRPAALEPVFLADSQFCPQNISRKLLNRACSAVHRSPTDCPACGKCLCICSCFFFFLCHHISLFDSQKIQMSDTLLKWSPVCLVIVSFRCAQGQFFPLPLVILIQNWCKLSLLNISTHQTFFFFLGAKCRIKMIFTNLILFIF